MAAALSLEGTVRVVAQGGVFRAIERLLGFESATEVGNAALVRFDPPASGRDPWRIERV